MKKNIVLVETGKYTIVRPMREKQRLYQTNEVQTLKEICKEKFRKCQIYIAKKLFTPKNPPFPKDEYGQPDQGLVFEILSQGKLLFEQTSGG